MPKITKTAVDTAKPGDRPRFLWDTEIRGFGLLVMPTGVKSFVFQYRSPEGRTRRATIGRVSATMTAEQAREKAKKLRRAVEDGRDPLGEKQELRESKTVADLLGDYLESGAFAEKAESTRDVDRGRIKRHLLPTLGKCYLHKLSKEDVRRAFRAISEGKTAVDEKTGKPRGRAIVTGGEGTARSAIRLLRAALTWGTEQKYRIPADNPADISIGSDGEREAVLDAEEYARLFRTLDTMENQLRLSRAAADAIRVTALTGARRGEITGLVWRFVDLKASKIEIPAKLHKTGRKTGKPRVITLPAAAQAIIARQPEGGPDDLVFPGQKGRLALSKHFARVRAEAGLPEGFGLHCLRHSYGTTLAIEGAQAAEIMGALGHRQLSTTQRYIHSVDDARKRVAEKAAASITAALKGTEAAEVVRLQKDG
jgi:integrase